MAIMKKSGVVIALVLMFSILSVSAFAQRVPTLCEKDADCTPPQTCDWYENLYGYTGYACGNGPPFEACPSEGSCFEEHGPGCDDKTCCNIVCSGDPFCCGENNGGFWDGLCVDDAFDLCNGEPTPSGPFSVLQGLLDQAIAENLLLDKELFVSHIIKEETFQYDIKYIEITWQEAFVSNFAGDKNTNCKTIPLFLMLSKREYRYGKLDESDAFLDKLNVILRTPELREQHGVTEEQFDLFLDAKSKAEQNELSKPALAARFKCCSYNALKHSPLVLNDDGTCEPPRRVPPTSSGGGSRFSVGVGCTQPIAGPEHSPIYWLCSTDNDCQNTARGFGKSNLENFVCRAYFKNIGRLDEKNCQCYEIKQQPTEAPTQPPSIPPKTTLGQTPQQVKPQPRATAPQRRSPALQSPVGAAYGKTQQLKWPYLVGILTVIAAIGGLLALLLRPRLPKPSDLEFSLDRPERRVKKSK